MAGVLASSLALMFIAMDRYRNVVYALSKRWNPPLWVCLIGTAVFWVISFAVSYPIYSYFAVLTTDDGADVCFIPMDKTILRNYYIIMVVVIFLPLLGIFSWFYYKIAALIWKHRKPLSTIFKKETHSNQETSSFALPEIKKTQDEIRVERKIRTFKIVITLMIVFIVCRLPYFAIQIFKSVYSVLNDTNTAWNLGYTFMALHIVNCALNPLLYTFLNSTLKVWFKIWNLVCEICCICCSTDEFDSLDRENPFTVENAKKNCKNQTNKVRFKF